MFEHHRVIINAQARYTETKKQEQSHNKCNNPNQSNLTIFTQFNHSNKSILHPNLLMNQLKLNLTNPNPQMKLIYV